MKRLRDIILGLVLLLSTLTVAAQDTVSFYRIPTASVSNLTDQLAVVQGDSTVTMTVTLMVDYLEDSIDVARDSLDSYWVLLSAYGDSITWLSDSIDSYWLLIQAVEDSITWLSDSTDAQRVSINANTGNISTNATGVAANLVSIGNLDDTVTVYRDTIDNYWTLIQTNLTNISKHADTVSVFRDSIDSQDTRLDAIEGAGYTTDHGSLSGLSGDDHTQYHNDTRAAAWLATQAHSTLTGSGDSTHAVIDAHLGNTANPHSVDAYDVLPDTSSMDSKYLQYTIASGLAWATAGGGGAGGDTTHTHTDTISEYTGAHGVRIDGLLIKDGGIGYIDDSIQVFSDTLAYLLPYVDTIDNMYGVLDSSYVSASIGTINEYTATNGVTIDGVLLKDGGVTVSHDTELYLDGGGDTYFYETLANTISHIAGGESQLDISDASIFAYDDFMPSPTSTYDLGSSSFYWQEAYLDTVFIKDGNTKIYKDGSNNAVISDAVTGAKTLAQLASAAASDSSFTSITVDTVLFGDGDTYINEFSDGVIRIYSESSLVVEFDNLQTDYSTNVDLNGNRLYFDNLGTSYAEIDGDTLKLTDAVTGTKTLADLAETGTSYDSTYIHARVDSIWDELNDTVALGSLVRLLEDTTDLWTWNFIDSAQFNTTQWCAWWRHDGPDTMVVTKVVAICLGGSPNFQYNVSFNDSISFTGDYTDLWTTDLTVTGAYATSTGEVDTSPNNAKIPPGNIVMIRFTDLTTKPPDGCSFNFYGYEK